MLLDLAVVMPVFNEQDCIVKVVKSWIFSLASLGIEFKIIVLNDGSYDGTQEALKFFENDERVEIINKANSGHGPTILVGYRHSVQNAEWTFQCDSDDEMKPDHFLNLWNNRAGFDALFGVRKEREQNMGRRLISACSRTVVSILFGQGVTDVNTPYRLIRSNILRQIINQIPADTFAPNVIISGILSKYDFRIYEYPVPHENRKTGQVSIVKWKLWKSVMKAFYQTLIIYLNIKPIPQ
jgi:glycosyltransferase involved in cell wall biosynthesis